MTSTSERSADIAAPGSSERAVILQGARLLCPQSGLDRVATVRIQAGEIVALDEAAGPDDVVLECTGATLTPGLFCPGVVRSDPGFEDEETLPQTLNRAAAGGFTDIIGLPTTAPAPTRAHDVAALQHRCAPLEGARLHMAGALMDGPGYDQLSEMGEMARAGACAVADAPAPRIARNRLRRALEYATTFDLPVLLGASDAAFDAGAVATESARACRLGLPMAPACAEDNFIYSVMAWCRLTGARVHLLGVSTAASVDLLRRARDEGLALTASASVYHAAFDETLYDATPFDPRHRLTPPLRIATDRAAVAAAVQERTLTLCTLHKGLNTHNIEQEFGRATPLAPALGAALDVAAETLGLVHAVAGFTGARAALLGGAPPRIAVGAPADLALFVPAEDGAPRSDTDGMRHAPEAQRTRGLDTAFTLRDGRPTFLHAGYAARFSAAWPHLNTESDNPRTR